MYTNNLGEGNGFPLITIVDGGCDCEFLKFIGHVYEISKNKFIKKKKKKKELYLCYILCTFLLLNDYSPFN